MLKLRVEKSQWAEDVKTQTAFEMIQSIAVRMDFKRTVSADSWKPRHPRNITLR